MGGWVVYMRLTLFVFLLSHGVTTFAQDRSPMGEAKWLAERIAGVKISNDNPILVQMADKVKAGDRQGAAALATTLPQFLNVTVKQFGAQMSSREETIREPLNDFTATIMGVVRDGIDARQLLHGDFYYAATDPTLLPAGVTLPSNFVPDLLRSNNHYAALERANVDIAKTLIKIDGQQIATSDTTSIPSPDPAGILTSRAFLAAHAVMGTNRRLVEFTFREFMCLPIAGWADTLGSDFRIGRDVDRFPGGDNSKFLTTCKGCHSMQDGFRGAFAKWDFPGNAAIHVANGVTQGELQPRLDGNRPVIFKMNRPDFVQYAGGYVTTDDSFVNNAIRGANSSLLGWRDPAPDTSMLSSRTAGVHAFGRLIAGSKRFPYCMAKRVWASVCHNEFSQAEMDAIYATMGGYMEQNGYDLKKLFIAVAAHPRCRL